MKKLAKIVTVLTLALSCAVSAPAMSFTVGGKGALFVGAGSEWRDDSIKGIQSSYEGFGGEFTTGGNVGGGFGLYAALNFASLGIADLGVQTELDFFFNNGVYCTASQTLLGTTKLTGSVSTLDIPVLFTADFNFTKKLSVEAESGFYLSIPLSPFHCVATYPSVSGSQDQPVRNLNVGMIFGAGLGYKMGPGSLVGNIRYLFDFTGTQTEADSKISEAYIRRGLTFSVGYQYTFNL